MQRPFPASDFFRWDEGWAAWALAVVDVGAAAGGSGGSEGSENLLQAFFGVSLLLTDRLVRENGEDEKGCSGISLPSLPSVSAAQNLTPLPGAARFCLGASRSALSLASFSAAIRCSVVTALSRSLSERLFLP